MSELRELYQEMILDHGKRPRNCHELTDADHRADGHNPLCGDRMTVFLRIEDDRIVDASFTGTGCAISTASASLMTEALKGKTVDEARRLFGSFHGLVTGDSGEADDALDKLVVLAGVRDFPVRVKCATLAWHTLSAALEGRESTTISTE